MRFWSWTLVFVACLESNPLSHADSKFIRLRNELIETPAPEASSKALVHSGGDEVVSGLFLLQFQSRFEPGWREELHKLGVELVRFVPDDAFLAHLDRVSPNTVRALPFVRWLGPYRPNLKIHSDLLRPLKSAAQTNGQRVSVLVASGIADADLARLRHAFLRLPKESRSSLGIILTGEVGSQQLSALASADWVLWIEAAPRMHIHDEISSKIVAGSALTSISNNPGPDSTGDPLGHKDGRPRGIGDSTHATATQQLGFDGRDVTVAVVDSGLNNGDAETMHPDLVGRVDGFFFYGGLRDASDENGHGTHVAGIVAGDAATGETDDGGALYGLGVAPKAHIIAQRVFDAQGQDELPDYEVLTHDAVRSGATIGSNSWGDDVQGHYDLSAARFDALVRDADLDTPGDQSFILEFSAGNAGPGAQSIDSPGVAKNVMAIGASENDRFDFALYTDGHDFMADFSSRGPCEDGRIKPDVVAPGTWIASLQSASAGDLNAWAPISANYNFEGGTSQAVPHVSGAAAVFVQFYREGHGGMSPSPALVKAALINSATAMSPTADSQPIPNMDEGWGRVALTNVIGSTRSFRFVDQSELLTTGQNFEYRVIVADSTTPLKITLAYTDVPGLPVALPALVNDLDLEVVGPDGQTYHGNQFLNGESLGGVTAFDAINNIEAVHLKRPLPGDYLVRIRGRNIVEDIHHRDAIVPQQDFALVISGDLPVPGVGVLVFDRQAYTAPGLINLKLLDSDLAGKKSIEVLLQSSTETNGEVLQLVSTDASGIFAGSMPVVLGDAAADGKLEIHNGDVIEARYQDAAPSALRTATARADLLLPLVRDVVATNRFGREVISWQTDEATRSIVVYGTNLNQMVSVTNQTLVTDHQVALQDLVGGDIYQFYIISTDEAGNSSTENNGSTNFTFSASPTPAVLLVNAYIPDDPIAGTKEIPLTTYTDPLDRSGFNYEVWDLTLPDSRSPELEDLSSFRAVIWRLSDSYASKATLTAAQQGVLSSYVQGGGSLMIASMELLSRIGGVPFRTNILQVQTFLTNVNHTLAQCPTCDEDHGVEAVGGAIHDLIGDGVQAQLDYSAYDSDVLDSVGIPSDMSDTFGPSDNATPIFFDADSRKVTGIRYPITGKDTAGRVVFLAFPFDALPETNRIVLMGRILSFLAPDSANLATIALDRAAYSVPDFVTVEVTDASKAGEGEISAQFYTSTATNGITIRLIETPRRGLFRGFVTLVAAADSSVPGRVPAHAGDAIWVQYADPSVGQSIQADADIDISAPQIQNVVADVQFEAATVHWKTSELTDGLVQFGESPFLGRTAYSAEPTSEHILTLTGLKPDRPYFFQVVSRDNAGNTAVDNNGGKLYNFRTAKPVFPPWLDSFENGPSSWTVETLPESESSWELGPPNNGRETQAHSPTHAWGSNLSGQPVSFVQSSLLSPPLALIGGNYATLRFWHSYDFSSDAFQELGQLLVRTNEQSDGIVLDDFHGSTQGWQEAVYDLSRYIGGVVRLEWSYSFAAIDQPTPQPGWLVDDVSLVVTNLVSGSIIVSNNLAQATFSLSGPINRNGQGWSTTFSHAPPGEYIVQFDEVPYYQTPLPQTNVLGDTPLLFQGVYTFDDANTNGIPDAWEEQYFGSINPSPPEMDSDNDGVSNYSEFVAGTDPTDPASNLHLAASVRLANGMCRLTWAAVPGRAYRVFTSGDLATWTAISGWVRASGNSLSYALSVDTSQPVFFRLQVSP